MPEFTVFILRRFNDLCYKMAQVICLNLTVFASHIFNLGFHYHFISFQW